MMSSMSGTCLLCSGANLCFSFPLCKMSLINDICSGHRIGTAEVESALVSHPKCAEAAVVGVEHKVILCMNVRICAHTL